MLLKTYRLETHVHTKYSHDSLLPFWLLYLKCRLCRIDYIAVTEHNNIDGAVAFKDYCCKRDNKVNVIVGEEIMSQSGEIIGLFLSKQIEAGLTVKETIRRILDQDGLVYVPHPYDLKRSKTVLKEVDIIENVDNIHCIEIHNGRNISEDYSIKQKAISDKLGILGVVGSDAHTCFEVGRNFMQVAIAPTSPKAFCEAIVGAKFNKSSCLCYSHIITKFVRVTKFLLKGDLRGLYRIVNKKFGRKE